MNVDGVAVVIGGCHFHGTYADRACVIDQNIDGSKVLANFVDGLLRSSTDRDIRFNGEHMVGDSAQMRFGSP